MRRCAPHALYLRLARYGLEFVTFALDTLWLGEPRRPPILRGMNVEADFASKLARFDKATRQRLRYYARFAPPRDGVRLWVRRELGCCILFLWRVVNTRR